MTAITENELMTPKQREQREKEQQVLKMFKTSAEEYIGKKGVSPERLLIVIGEKFNMTATGVKQLLRRYGEFESCVALRAKYCNI